MKKSTKIAIIVIVAVLIFMALVIGAVIGLVSFLNKEKDSITAEQFKQIMEQENYRVVDARDQVAQFDIVDQVYLAVDSKYNYRIEFYQLENGVVAAVFYNKCVSTLKETKGSSVIDSNISGRNYSKYTLETNGQYSVVSRINDTVAYINADSQYKDAIKNILDEIGY